MARMVALAGLLAATSAYGAALDRIRNKGEIVLGYVADAAPFSYADGKGQPEGYSVDLCREIATGIQKQLALAKLDVRWVQLTSQDRIPAVRAGRVDIECSTTTWTLGRQQEVDFSLITFVDGASIIAKDTGDIHRFADFAGRRIAVIRGTTTVGALQGALSARGMASVVVPVADRAEGLRMLQKGEVQGFASDRIVLIALALKDPATENFRILDDDFSLEQYALALPRGDHDFRLAVNRVITGLYRTGAIMPIYKRSLGMLGEPSMLLRAAYFLQSLAD
ncbi:MAG TPA: amino acid ABC transporter substrate-binding protein [Burkholderiales bacterium]|nr:amino acid ABC transporter substrate-binding protein [Burkholderiales bacterium]